MTCDIFRQPIPPLPNGDGAICFIFHHRPNPHSGGHGEEHGVTLVSEQHSHLFRCAGAENFALIHNGHGGSQRKGFFQPMLGQNDGDAKFTVDLTQRSKKVTGGDGIKLTGRLVQNQD